MYYNFTNVCKVWNLNKLSFKCIAIIVASTLSDALFLIPLWSLNHNNYLEKLEISRETKEHPFGFFYVGSVRETKANALTKWGITRFSLSWQMTSQPIDQWRVASRNTLFANSISIWLKFKVDIWNPHLLFY